MLIFFFIVLPTPLDSKLHEDENHISLFLHLFTIFLSERKIQNSEEQTGQNDVIAIFFITK